MKNQKLYWSVGMALRWLGLTIDEWFFLLSGIIPGIFLVNSGSLKYGSSLICLGIIFCYGFKKFKKLSENFLIKSFLLSRGLFPKPSKNYPNLLGMRIGK
jgi:hypothetical protein